MMFYLNKRCIYKSTYFCNDTKLRAPKKLPHIFIKVKNVIQELCYLL